MKIIGDGTLAVAKRLGIDVVGIWIALWFRKVAGLIVTSLIVYSVSDAGREYIRKHIQGRHKR